ncbi:alpha-ketoacid dehydrogenase subunit beta [Streptomyces coffeae]|uniref:Pyruvate dehydrogenase E1 component subunit beta n=1 Tax=Streptomyces coffeae TaxID=621382 RepID=A0ABS1NKL7_9ACTN|nr:transketolase C-terminal domain-containing protein [Streptomyces coffeae]MBL1100569.1 alpha-ketoacid dehydrogenase subunit beta [Streptomyces coffeae]
MPVTERVVENLNHALHGLFERDGSVYLLGEDIKDPYGGAFKVTRGLSERYGDRVLATPLSEGGIVGVAAGLALTGDKAIVEIMFGDFIALAFDQILNFASKSVSMYGRRVPLRLVVRCPTGGNRGYGPTHSQSPQKHFVGIPGLSLYELSPFHENDAVLERMFRSAEPCVLFEDKVLYTRRMYRDGVVDDLFRFDYADPDREFARVHIGDPDDADVVLIAPGGLVDRALAAMRGLLLDQEITCQLVVPSRLYPFDPDPLLPMLAAAGRVCVIEESTAGGTWGSEIAQAVHSRLWGKLAAPVRLVHSADSVIPSAAHLERDVLVQSDTIYHAVQEMFVG